MSTFWDGAGAALIGSAFTGIVAVLAIIWTRRDERRLVREQMSLTAAYELMGIAFEVNRRVAPFIHKHRPNALIHWEDVSRFVDRSEADADHFYAYRTVIRPLRIEDYLAWVWEDPSTFGDRVTPEVLSKQDGEVLDNVARSTGQGLTNLIDELGHYLRADLKLQEWARMPLRRRFKAVKRPPFLRRARLHEVVERDEYGSPEADY